MSDDPFDFSGGAVVPAASTKSGKAVATCYAEDIGCGLDSVEVKLEFTAEEASGGALGRNGGNAV